MSKALKDKLVTRSLSVAIRLALVAKMNALGALLMPLCCIKDTLSVDLDASFILLWC